MLKLKESTNFCWKSLKIQIKNLKYFRFFQKYINCLIVAKLEIIWCKHFFPTRLQKMNKN